MPHITAFEPLGAPQLVPIDLRHAIGDATGREVLVAAHDLQNAVGVVGHGVVADELVRHGNAQQQLHHIEPVVHRFVVEVRPMELEFLVERAVRARIGEVLRLLRRHGHEYLHEREQPREHPFMGIFANLPRCLAHGHTALLQLEVEKGHSVDEQHEIAPAVVAQLRL